MYLDKFSHIRNFLRPASVAFCIGSTLTYSLAIAQEATSESVAPPEKILEEIVVEGRKMWEGHDGMEAFWNGDYEKAEIEFEHEFKSLKRGRSARYNAAVDAANGIDRALDSAASSGNNTQIIGTGPGAVAISNSSAIAVTPATGSNFRNKRVKGQNLLNDGKDTDEDFAFTKYMAGISELQLKKYAEAKQSFKSSLFYNGSNYDARMRLGLLYIIEGDIDKSADQLEAMDKLRVKCKKKQCSEYDEIVESASTLANSLSNAISKLEGK